MVYRSEFIMTLAIVLGTISIMFVTKLLVKRFVFAKSLSGNRKKIILNLVYIFTYLFAGIGLSLVWGLGFKDFWVFVSSVTAILGIALFAQWSILSNVTASMILFFSHPLRIGDRIRILDKDFPLVGEVKDITGFFLYLETDEKESITLPTTMILQKGIHIMDRDIK